MIVEIYIVIDDAGDRPYVSTTAPSVERLAALHTRGARLYRALVHLPHEERGRKLPDIQGEPFPLP